MQIQPYLFFNGTCEEAIAFYKRAIGAEVEMLLRYRESPEPPPPDQIQPGMDDKVMHASLRIGDSVVMASDDCSLNPSQLGGFSLSLNVPDTATADRMFAALAEGGAVQMPLGTTFWSPRFGMLVDKFGVAWMVSVMP